MESSLGRDEDANANANEDARGRRAVLVGALAAVGSFVPARVDASPTPIGLYQDPSRVQVGEEKVRVDGDAVLETLTRDVAERRYFVTGDLTEEYSPMIVDLSIPRRKSPVCRGICGRFARCSTLRGPRWSSWARCEERRPT